jgi:hypothetical protein
MTSKLSHTLSKVVLGCLSLYFIYIISNVLSVVNKRHIGTTDGTYVNNTRQNSNLHTLAQKLSQNCQDEKCQVQNILDYVTNIPYKVNNFTAHSPQQTIQKNFGDCDDKSNLLISLLHELNIESYFVLVPEHIFVIVSIPQLEHKKALYINKKPYYILESTAKNSGIGFPLRYHFNEIHAIVEPFENRKIEIDTIEYK